MPFDWLRALDFRMPVERKINQRNFIVPCKPLSQMLPSNKETTSKIQARVFDSGHLLILRFARLSLQAILKLGTSNILQAE